MRYFGELVLTLSLVNYIRYVSLGRSATLVAATGLKSHRRFKRVEGLIYRVIKRLNVDLLIFINFRWSEFIQMFHICGLPRF